MQPRWHGHWKSGFGVTRLPDCVACRDACATVVASRTKQAAPEHWPGRLRGFPGRGRIVREAGSASGSIS